jgi:hypothetical protein
MALQMEHPAPALTLLDGGRRAMDSDYPRGPHPQDTRTYLDELISGDPYYLNVAAIDAFADTLAARFPERDPMHRDIAHMLLIAYMDAWLAGYESGYYNGIDEGKDIVRLGLRDTLPGDRS